MLSKTGARLERMVEDYGTGFGHEAEIEKAREQVQNLE